MRLTADAHVPLGHDLEQRGLHLRRCPVDLVDQDEVREDRAQLDVELLRRLAVDPGADDVGRDKVGSELKPDKGAADDARQRLHGERLGNAGYALEQAVATRKQADEHPLDHVVLAHDDALHLDEGLLQQICGRRVGGVNTHSVAPTCRAEVSGTWSDGPAGAESSVGSTVPRVPPGVHPAPSFCGCRNPTPVTVRQTHLRSA